jgi:sporulation protein YqfC
MAPEAVGCLRVTLIDNTHAYIENHRGVLEYTTRRVCVRAQQTNVTVSGEGLMLERFGREDVAIRGDIHEVQYEMHAEGAEAP